MSAEPRPADVGAPDRRTQVLRLSGLVLAVLIVGHLVVTTMVGGGVQRVDYAYVAGRWASPFWQTWDLLLIWLALAHGGLAVRAVIERYVHQAGTRLALAGLLWTVTAVAAVLGTVVVLTFGPRA